MAKDPYSVLGVSSDATDDEVKRAYRELARKYHPDNFSGNSLADLAEEKMKEINEAYDTIQKMRASGGGAYGSSSSSGGGYGGASSDSAGSGGSTAGMYRVRELINAGRTSEAEVILDGVPDSERGAEWNFLRGCVLVRRGWYFDAQKYFDTACYMDPNNQEYRSAREQLKQSSASFGRGYRTTTNQGECGGCDICTSLICADCCCECMGGDLISCC